MSEEKMKEILNLDYRLEESQERIQKILYKIKPLAKYKDLDEIVPVEKIEKVVGVLSRKYGMIVREILLMHDPSNHENIYCAVIQDHTSKEVIRRIHGRCVYELFSKIAIYMYDRSRQKGER